MTRKVLFTAAAVAAIGTLVLFVVRVPFNWAGLVRSLEPTYLLPAYLAYSVALLAAATAWHDIVGAIASQGSYRRNIQIYVTTAFARRLPGSLWGIALRTYWYRRFGSDWRHIGLASVVEIWAAVTSGTILAILAAAVYFQRNLSYGTWCLLILLFLVIAASWHPVVRRRAISLSLRLIRAPDFGPEPLESGRLVRICLWEAVTWLFGGLELAFLLRAMTPYPLATLPLILASWFTAGIAGTLITLLPGGFALVEITLTALLSTLLPLPIALAAAVLLRVFTTLSELTWMVLGMGVAWITCERADAGAARRSNHGSLSDITGFR